MRCSRSVFSSWRRPRAALISSHAATRVSGCSGRRTTG
uniref:Uncharacterized protein n=1 Tax=Anguilla anguilla TaxID=7936 RepID=A0A0E9TE82_ANGAN